MKVSLNTVKQYTQVDLSIDELVAKINSQLGGVEELTNLGERYEGAVIVKIVACDDHPNADRLHVCKVDDGGVVKDVPRDDDGYVQVVCGAPNARSGIFVVWLPPKTTVPSSYSEKELFVLDARELRGVVSQGMLASPKELGLGDSHDGILEIDPDDWKPNDTKIKPGASFAKAYGLDDYTIDIENKMFTHRPDCFGQLGVAREIAGIQHMQFTSPDWYIKEPSFTAGDGLDLHVFNEVPQSVPRFMSVAIQDVKVGPSPVWLQAELVRLGGKPINNIVDVTNYLMLLTGQPLHAYDYDKLRGKQLGARMAHDGEKALLLNGKTYELTRDDIVIADGEGPVGLAGVMGGGESEVSDETTRIVLECGSFDMYAVRKSSMRYGLFTDAVTRFNKGQSPKQNDYIVSLAISSVHDVAGGTLASHIFDIHEATPTPTVEVTPQFINERLGLSLKAEEIKSLLTNVEFGVDGTTKLRITVPFWRTDIELPEDIVEEVGRLYGFDALPRVLPQRSISPTPKNPTLQLKDLLRQSLTSAGANEVLTYSFVHENVMKKAGQDPSEAFRLGNALSPHLQYYRLSVLPSLLDKVHANIKGGYDEFALYEIGKGHHKQNIGEDGLPHEVELLELVYTSRKPRPGAPYFRAQRFARHVLDDLGIEASFVAIDSDMNYAGAAPFERSRSSVIQTSGGTTLGMVGELKSTVQKQFKLPEYTAVFTLDIASLLAQHDVAEKHYVPLSKYPKVTQDISLRAPSSVSHRELFTLATDTIKNEIKKGEYSASLDTVSIYQPADDDSSKTTTLRLTIASFEKTLTDKEVNVFTDAIASAAQKIDAVRV